MTEVWEFVRAFREWADLIGLLLLVGLVVGGSVWIASGWFVRWIKRRPIR